MDFRTWDVNNFIKSRFLYVVLSFWIYYDNESFLIVSLVLIYDMLTLYSGMMSRIYGARQCNFLTIYTFKCNSFLLNLLTWSFIIMTCTPYIWNKTIFYDVLLFLNLKPYKTWSLVYKIILFFFLIRDF